MENTLRAHSHNSGKLAQALLLLGISLGYFMVLLDTTVVSVALPAIHADLGGGITGLQWIVNAYTIVFAGLLLSMGTITDKLGAKRIYIVGLALFFAASGFSSMAQSLGALIVLRALLGVGGAALLPASLTLIAHVFPEPAMRARALGIWGAVTGVALAAGPVVGGLLVDSLGWRSIFLLNLPLAVISLILISRYTTETTRQPQLRLDLAGQVPAISFIVVLSFALMEGGAYGWSSPLILVALGIALACIILFLIVEATSKAPLLPLRLFKKPTLSAGMLAGMLVNIGLSGILFMMPLFFQQTRGLSAHSAGLALLPMMIPMAINPIFTGRIVGRTGPRIPMTAGFLLGAMGMLMLIGKDRNMDYTLTMIGLFLLGIGISFTIPALMAAVISSVPTDQVGAISGALNSSRQLGATLGVAILGAILSSSGALLTGMNAALMVTASIFVGGSLLSFLFIRR